MSADDPTILIVDDDDLVRSAFERVLQRGGFRVWLAADGIEGLEAFRRHRPDGVLLDLRMPGMDGLDVLSAIVEESPDTAIVVASGEGTMHDAVEALRRGAWDYVVKPIYDAKLLVHSFSRAFEKVNLKRQNDEYRHHLERANRMLTGALAELQADQQGARVLQFQLLPKDGVEFGGYTFFHRMFPSFLLSGDFVDYFPLGDRFAGFYVADVAGHGAASAFVTAILTTLVDKYRQALATSSDETVLHPAELLARLGDEIAALDLSKHVTMFYGVLDLDGERLRYANAALFPFPLVRDGNGDVTVLECPGRALGLPGRGQVGAGEVEFPRSARLFMATDGILEVDVEDSARTRRDEIATAFESAEDIDSLSRGLGLGGQLPLRDDVAILYVCGTEKHHA